MPAVSSIVIRSAEQLVAVEPAAAPRVSVAQVSPPRGLPGAEIELRVNDTHVQWRVVGAATWTNLIALSAITGPAGATGATGAAGATGATGAAGANGQSPELQVDGTLLQWRYAGSGGAWTTLFDLDTLAGGSDVTETVPAVAQVTNITMNANSASDLDGDYIDVPVIGATVRAWFNVDNSTSPPAVPSPGRLIPVAISSSGSSADFFAALAAALDSDPDLEAYYLGGMGSVTQPGGALPPPTSTDLGNIGLGVATAGADAYDRLIQIDASQVTNVPPQAVNMGDVYRVLASLSDPTGQSVPLTQLLDLVIGSTRGSMIVRGAASWQQLAGSGLLRLISGADPALLSVSGMLVNSSYHEKRDPASITGSTFGSVMTASHTPKFANSTIVAIVFATVGGAASQVPSLRLTRGGTALLLGDAASLRTRVTTSGGVPGASALNSATFAGKDTPGTTSPVTYNLELASHSTGTVRLNATGTDSDTAAFQRGATSILFLEFAA